MANEEKTPWFEEEVGLIGWEVFGGGDPTLPQVKQSHYHLNCLFIPKIYLSKLERGFEEAARDQGLLVMKEPPRNPVWPFVRVRMNGVESYFTPPPPSSNGR